MSRRRGGLAADRAEKSDRVRSTRRRPTRRARHRGATGREDRAGDGDRRRPQARRGADHQGSDGVRRGRTRQSGRHGPLRGADARAKQQLGDHGSGALSCACGVSAGFRRRNRGRCAVARSRPARIRVGIPDVRHLRARGTHAATIHRRSDPRGTRLVGTTGAGALGHGAAVGRPRLRPARSLDWGRGRRPPRPRRGGRRRSGRGRGRGPSGGQAWRLASRRSST